MIKIFKGVTNFTFSKNKPYSKYLAFHDANTIIIWDIANQKTIRTIQINSPTLDGGNLYKTIRALTFHHNSNYIVFSHKNKIAIFDIQENKYITKFKAHHGNIYDLAVSLDGTKLASCTCSALAQDKLKVWDITGLCAQAKHKQQEQENYEDEHEKKNYLKDNLTDELKDLDFQYPIKLKNGVILNASKALLN